MESVVTRLEKLSAPYGKEVTLENVTYENDTRVLRIHIREGNRFTVMDLDAKTASSWASIMKTWVDQSTD